MISKELNKLLDNLGLKNTSTIYALEGKKWEKVISKEIGKRLMNISPDAFYVFNNQPYILFFDLTGNNYNKKREDEIHKKVWSFDQSPIIFILKDEDIEVYNAFAFEKQKEQEGRLERIPLNKLEREKMFSFWSLQSGNVWKWLQFDYYENNKKRGVQKRVNQRLFENIKDVRETLMENGYGESDANILILRLIFIRYLIDRGIKIEKEFITGKTIADKRNSFYEILGSKTNLNKFFNYLNERFNGVLFKDAKIKLSAHVLNTLADIFDSRKNKDIPSLFDKYYFDVYDFSIIPVELISGIYESLMNPETKEADSAVYTPTFLVDYILNDTVDVFLYEKKRSECKVFDPSCGSGIFLVQSLRRMIDKEIELYKPDIKTKKFSTRIREIATHNLFGVDKNREALKVTCFSVYVALLDYQDPPDIDKFEFPNLLDENFFSDNFFNGEAKFNELIKSEKVDFILGNPPWKNGSGDPLHVEYLNREKLSKIVSNFQLAQSFILRTKDFVSESTKCALVITSKSIYNINADRFRKYFLENMLLTKCFDLSPVRRLVFETDNPAMVFFFKRSKDKRQALANIVLHQSLKYNIYLKYFKTLVIEKGENKKVKQELFYNHHWMFKVALYGSVLDFNLMTKIHRKSETIEEHINKFRDSIHWGDGIKKLTPYSISKLKNKAEPFIEIENIPVVETREIMPYYTTPQEDNLPSSNDLMVKSGRNINLFLGEKILFSQNLVKETELLVSYVANDAVFREKTLGITTRTEAKTLKELYAVCQSDLFKYYLFLTTSNWAVYYAVILQKEYLSFPYAKFNKEEKTQLVKLGNGIIQYFKKLNTGHLKVDETAPPNKLIDSINNLVYTNYEICEYERDLIDYVLKISRYQFQSEAKQRRIIGFTSLDKNHYRNEENVLTEYSKLFIQEFEIVYKDEYIRVDIYSMDYFIAVNFSFCKKKPKVSIVYHKGDSDELELLEKIANSISVSKIEKELFIQRDIKGFEQNSFYIIKPKEFKCWHKAMAWYDIAEFKEQIQSNELKSLKVEK